MRAVVFWCTVLALSVAVVADDQSVIFDEDLDFSTLRTFTMQSGRMVSERPELNFPATMTALGEAIRRTLVANGMKDVPDHADVTVEFSVNAVDYGIGPAGRANVIRPAPRGGRGGRVNILEVAFTEATLVVDLKHGDPEVLVWRGVYHDTENEARKLAEALPTDAVKLLSRFPPVRKK